MSLPRNPAPLAGLQSALQCGSGGVSALHATLAHSPPQTFRKPWVLFTTGRGPDLTWQRERETLLCCKAPEHVRGLSTCVYTYLLGSVRLVSMCLPACHRRVVLAVIQVPAVSFVVRLASKEGGCRVGRLGC